MPTSNVAQPDWESQFQLAERLFAGEAFADAEQAYLAVIAANQEHSPAYVRAGHCARKRGDRAAALGYFQTAARLSPNTHGLHLEVAAELREFGRLDEAEALCREIVNLAPDNAQAYTGLARCARMRGDRAAALGYFQTAARLSPNTHGLHLEVAAELREFGRLDEAEALCREILSLVPDDAHAYTGLAHCARKRGDRATALGYFQTAARLSPNTHGLHLEVVAELRELDRLEEAEAICHEILNLAPDNAQAYTGLARCARMRGDRAAALGYFQTAARLSPNTHGLHLEAAAELRDLGRLDEAEALCREILSLVPDDAHAYTGLAHCARKRGDRATALGYFQTAVRLSPNTHGLHLEVVAELREFGRLDEAEAICHAVLNLAPDNAQAYTGLARCARMRGDRAASLGYFQTAARLLPDTHGLHLEVAAELREFGRLDEAEAICREILNLAPDNAQAYTGLAHCARKRGDRAAARAHLKAAVNAAPGDTSTRLEIANEQREAGDFDAARETVLALLAQHSLSLEAMLSLGHIERAAARYEASLAAFQRAHIAYPTQARILVEMAMDERQLGRQANCNKYLEQALALNPLHVPALARLAEQAMVSNDVEKAYQDYQHAATDQPWELTFQLGRLDALAKMGKADDAIASLLKLEEKYNYAANIRIKRASLLRQSGYYYEALQLMREATAEFPYDFGLWAERFQVELLVGDATHVETCLQEMPADTAIKKAAVERFKAIWAENKWQIEDAIRHYENSAIMNPKDSALQHDLARTKLLLMDLAGVRTHLKRANELNAVSLKLRGKSLNISQSHLGQMLDEYCLDQELAAGLVQLQSLPLTARALMLAGMVRDNPDSTAAAVSLMIALRQGGALRGGATDPGRSIPRVVTQFWDSDELPGDVIRIMQSWPEQNPDYTVRLFNDTKAQEWLAKHYPRPVLEAFRHAQEPAQKADIFRLALLAIEGGVYVDADDRCLMSLKTIIPDTAELVLWQENLGTVGNNFIAAAPNHPVLRRALELAVSAINRGDADILWLSTGPGLLTRALSQVLVKNGGTILPRLVVLDRRDLYKAVAIHCSVGYKKTKRHWSNSAFGQLRKSV